MTDSPHSIDGSPDALQRYYRLHAKVYDISRWTFLFGRGDLCRRIARLNPAPRHVLEVGCGTGVNLAALAGKLPEARLTGLDLSEAMLDRAGRKLKKHGDRVALCHRRYDASFDPDALDGPAPDCVVFSYALTMFNPGWAEAIETAAEQLPPGGVIAVADFHDSAFGAFKKWMALNHVRLDGHLLPKLRERFEPETALVRRAYGGIWKYLTFIGRKPI